MEAMGRCRYPHPAPPPPEHADGSHVNYVGTYRWFRGVVNPTVANRDLLLLTGFLTTRDGVLGSRGHQGLELVGVRAVRDAGGRRAAVPTVLRVRRGGLRPFGKLAIEERIRTFQIMKGFYTAHDIIKRFVYR